MVRTVVATLVVLLTVTAGVGSVAAPATAQSGGTVDCAFPVSKTDATGTDVTVEEDPERVVVLRPSAAQVMWAMGAQDEVVGLPINEYTAYLDGRQSKTDVVSNGELVRERIVGLNPDLVLAPNIVQNGTVENLRSAGLKVYRFRDATSFADVTAKTELTGRLVGEFEAAAQVAAKTRAEVAAVEDAVGGVERPRVYYPIGGGWTAGSDTFINDIITTAGASNIAAGPIDGYDRLSMEIVAEENPQWLVLQAGFPVPYGEALNTTTAVEAEQFVRVNPDFINQPGPRTVEVLQALTQAFHPDAYSQIDFSSVEAASPATCSDSGGGSGTATPGASGPGFTAGLALAALAAVAVLARRR